MNSQDESPDEPATEHDDDASGDGADDMSAAEDVETRSRRTIREQLATCGEATAILRKIDEIDASTGEIVRRYEFIEKLLEPLARVA